MFRHNKSQSAASTCLIALSLMCAQSAFAAGAKPEGQFSFDTVLTVDALNNLQGGLKTGGRGVANLDLSAAYIGDSGWEGLRAC